MIRTALHAGLLALLFGCGPNTTDDLIFVDGRAVAFAGDSLLALTMQGSRDILVLHRATGVVSRHAGDELESPHHLQEHDGHWFVSDVVQGRAMIVVFSDQWVRVGEIGVDSLASVPHQFAVLPDGRVVVESVDGRLLALNGDSISTFALVEHSMRNGMLVAAHGGVLHAVPGETLTLYNAMGNLRWRQEWPFHEGAFVTDLSVDVNGRVHILAGEEETNAFYAFTLSPVTGEAVRWTAPSRVATFIVKQRGEILSDSAARWIARN